MDPRANQQPHEALFPGVVPIPSLPIAAPPDTHGSSIDFNAAVILAAMLCALVCALGLNSMLQCVLHGTRRIFTEPAEWVIARRGNAGLKKEDVTALPTDTYATPGSPAAPSDCAICLAEFADGDRIRVLPQCNHRFHVVCVDTWLLSHSSCPTCRNCLSLDIVTAV